MSNEFEFFMDVSPNWWRKARKDQRFLIKHVCEKFETDYYPRIVMYGREKMDLDEEGHKIKELILKNLKNAIFSYEFLPEDESVKESYLISNGLVHFHARRKRINSRLLIRVKIGP